jgi:excisionase family DNA binding protein
MMEKSLDLQKLAETLKVRPGTVYSWISRGVDIPHVKISGTVRFRETAVMDWILKKEREKKRKKFEL